MLIERIPSLLISSGCSPRSVLLVADSALSSSTLARVTTPLSNSDITHCTLRLRAREASKSIDSLHRLWLAMHTQHLDASDAIIAIGGGTILDVAGFAASTYRRGIAWVACPTTLLACVDAGLGGKTAINLSHRGRRIKNAVGSFHAPLLTIADVSTLTTLPEDVMREGLAECIKHALLCEHAGTKGLLRQTRSLLATLTRPATLASLIHANLRVKARIVERDPLEREPRSGRVLLNLGHTFAHAIEPLGASHGSAVSLGLVAAAHAGLAMGTCSHTLVEDVLDTLGEAGLPTSWSEAGLSKRSFDPTRLIRAMRSTDKKVRKGKLRIIVPVGLRAGRCEVVSDPPDHALLAGWGSVE